MKNSVTITSSAVMLSIILTTGNLLWAQSGIVSRCDTVFQSANLINRPKLNDLLDNVYGVHAFTKPPQSGVIGVGKRPTKHFALGSLVSPHPSFHHDDKHSWDDKSFAVLRSLRKLVPQLINLNTYDTFILGDIVLSPGDVLVVPKSSSLDLPEGVAVVTYDPQSGSLRKAVSRVLASQNLWQFKMQNTADGEAQFGSLKINNPDFFSDLLRAHPHVSFGNHVGSKVGKAFVWGIIDQANMVLTHPNSYSSLQELILAKAVNTVLTPHLEKTVDLKLLPESARRTLEHYKNKISIFNLLIDLIIKAQVERGFTLRNSVIAKIANSANSLEDLNKQFEATLRLGEEQRRMQDLNIEAFVKSIDDNGHLTGKISNEPYSADNLSALLRVFDSSQISEMQQKFPLLFQGTPIEAFNLRYNIERCLEIGFENAKKENIPQKIKAASKIGSSKLNLENIVFQVVARLVGKRSIFWLDAEISEKLNGLGKLQDVNSLLQFGEDLK